MADFAKIVRATDGGQVLFYKDTGDDGEPVLKQITDMDGIAGALNLSFTDDDDGYDKRDQAFEQSGIEQADAVRKAFLSMLEGSDGSRSWRAGGWPWLTFRRDTTRAAPTATSLSRSRTQGLWGPQSGGSSVRRAANVATRHFNRADVAAQAQQALMAWEEPMAAYFLPKLQYELVRSIGLIRKAHDEYAAAYRVAMTARDKDQQHRLAQIGHALSDAINAAQGCLYEVNQAIRTSGVDSGRGGAQ